MGSVSVEGDTNVHGGAPFDTGLSSTVTIGGKKVALVDQTTSSQNDSQYNPRGGGVHAAGNQTAKGGSGTVTIEGKAVHRVGDPRVDGATAGPGVSSTNIG